MNPLPHALALLLFGAIIFPQSNQYEYINILSDSVEIGWIQEYGYEFPMFDYSNDVEVDGSGNVYVMGRSYSIETDNDIALIKYLSDGTEAWVSTYNGSANAMDMGEDMIVDRDGNIYVTGVSDGADTYSDIVTIKYNPDGTEIWVARYNGSSTMGEGGNSIDLDATGNVYVSGLSQLDYITIKYSAGGEELWANSYNGPANSYDFVTGMKVSDDGFVYVTGFSNGISTNRDIVTIKYNTEGAQVWVNTYNSPDNTNDESYAMTIDELGNVYVTGAKEEPEVNIDYLTIKYFSTGDLAWVATYNGPSTDMSWDMANAIVVDVGGNVFVTGLSFGAETYDDFATIKYSPSGTELWVQRYEGGGEAKAITVDVHGNVYITGTCFDEAMMDMDMDIATIKYDSSGGEEWIMQYSGPGEDCWDEAKAVTIDAFGNVYIAGTSNAIDRSVCTTIKYVQPDYVVSTKNVNESIGFSLDQNYPNPFNPTTTIKYSLSEQSFVKLTVFDIRGQEVKTLQNTEKPAGIYEVQWNGVDEIGKQISAGMYFTRLQASENFSVVKMLYLR